MPTDINTEVCVSLAYDAKSALAFPYVMRWNNRIIKFKKLGYHHKVYEGKTLVHYFHLLADSTFFKLRFDTDNLSWKLVEIVYDG